ncbi:MAG: type II toxin-antitoxin system VapC family toxin, partial [Bacteroidetes bacterium]|nr:type II toxin-antitoxin system VapC family toxin [Bacteroidota bacterium]
GLNRRKREGFLSQENYNLAKKHLLNDVRDTTILQITPSVVLHSIKLLEINTLRAMDAFHIACALEWKADLFVTSDKKQFEAAVNSGITSEFVGQQVH